MEEVAPGRFDVRVRPATVIVTAEEWEQVVRRHGTRRAWLFEHFDEFFGSKHSDDVFIVFWEGDLVGSVRDALPPVASLRELLVAVRRPVASRAIVVRGAYTPLKGLGSPGWSRTIVASPDSKSGGPCRQTNRG